MAFKPIHQSVSADIAKTNAGCLLLLLLLLLLYFTHLSVTWYYFQCFVAVELLTGILLKMCQFPNYVGKM